MHHFNTAQAGSTMLIVSVASLVIIARSSNIILINTQLFHINEKTYI